MAMQWQIQHIVISNLIPLEEDVSYFLTFWCYIIGKSGIAKTKDQIIYPFLIASQPP